MSETTEKRGPGRPSNAELASRGIDLDALLAEKLEAALPALLAKLAADQAPAAPGDHFASALATAIAKLGGQAGGKAWVDPAILEQRTLAWERMERLILEARQKGWDPQYRLQAKVHLDDMIVEPFFRDPATKAAMHTEIIWDGIPNPAMRPINAVAEKIFEAFNESLGATMSKDDPLGPMRVTAKGLTIVGQTEKRVAVTQPPTMGGLKIMHQRQPGEVVKTAILGTIAEPARQSA